MMSEFQMTDLGLLQYFLGLEVEQRSNGIFLNQRKYIQDLLKKFNMDECDAAITPMNTNDKFQRDDGTPSADEKLYRSLVGGLNYLTHTRPDISYCVSVVSRYLHKPSKQHPGAAKRILKYVVGTSEYGIWYSKSEEFKHIGYTDSDWAGAAARQAVWLRKLLADLGYKQKGVTELWCDNKSSIAMTKNPAFHARTKNIKVQHHFIRKLVSDGSVELKFCGTNLQNADLFTKGPSQAKHQFFMERIGVKMFESRGGVEI
ncbi:hypothetical protein RND81_13G008900 [Saponaria officinalis]|uniref:Reverse transcriptase Ty1/copia-type domain-containing protein n=1 Tax=Saponaria officinalis TaxID=3572 RepID=A0AAW1GVG3_SAPOF